MNSVGSVNYNFPGGQSLHAMVLSHIENGEFVFKNTYADKAKFTIAVGMLQYILKIEVSDLFLKTFNWKQKQMSRVKDPLLERKRHFREKLLGRTKQFLC